MNTKEPLRSKIKKEIEQCVGTKHALFANFAAQPGGTDEQKSLEILLFEILMPTIEQALLSRDREILGWIEEMYQMDEGFENTPRFMGGDKNIHGIKPHVAEMPVYNSALSDLSVRIQQSHE